jgi:hypothetical protein
VYPIYGGVSRLAGHLEDSSLIIASNMAFVLEVFLSFICILSHVILCVEFLYSVHLPVFVGCLNEQVTSNQQQNGKTKEQ